MDFHTADLCDAHEDRVRVLAPMLRSYGGARAAGGPVRTLKIFEDNALVREMLAEPGQGAQPAALRVARRRLARARGALAG